MGSLLFEEVFLSSLLSKSKDQLEFPYWNYEVSDASLSSTVHCLGLIEIESTYSCKFKCTVPHFDIRSALIPTGSMSSQTEVAMRLHNVLYSSS